ncbi:MAG TPA: hypothetical protein VJA47_02060 [archaeon]|nr:hypothetical protein [archaeon]
MPTKCPLCGTNGKVWNKQPEAFQCQQCYSIYSEFGLILDPQREMQEMWS